MKLIGLSLKIEAQSFKNLGTQAGAQRHRLTDKGLKSWDQRLGSNAQAKKRPKLRAYLSRLR